RGRRRRAPASPAPVPGPPSTASTWRRCSPSGRSWHPSPRDAKPMRLDHGFTVPVPVDVAWKVLLDLPRIAPCMPGATLTGVEGDTFTGTVKVKLGPITLTYQGKGRFVERDEAAHR